MIMAGMDRRQRDNSGQHSSMSGAQAFQPLKPFSRIQMGSDVPGRHLMSGSALCLTQHKIVLLPDCYGSFYFLKQDKNVFVGSIRCNSDVEGLAGPFQCSASAGQTRQLVVDLAVDQHVNLHCRKTPCLLISMSVGKFLVAQASVPWRCPAVGDYFMT